MKNLRFPLIRAVLLAFACLAGLVGCAKTNHLDPLQRLYLATASTARVKATFCMNGPVESRQKLKMLFLIDKSTSNQNLPESSDPSGLKRYSSLMDLLDTAEPDDNTYYGLINFSSGATTVQSFTNQLPTIRSVIRKEWTGTGTVQNPRPYDLGETDYLGAIEAARAEIKRDLEETVNSMQDQFVTSRYLVILVSDGYPGVGGVPQSPASIQAIIEPQYASSLLSLKNDAKYKKYLDDIILHTGYYYSSFAPDLNAQDILENAAVWGGGDFHIFGAGAAIDYALFAAPVRHVRNTLSDVFVENLSVQWWSDATLKIDTDHDGLPDEIETQLGSNPLLEDSDGNGVSDYVEYRTKGRPCTDSRCSSDPPLRDNYVACQGMILSQSGNRITFGDTDKDGLNDCEEWLLRSDRNLFDSNGDGIPDGIAFRNGLKFIAGGNDSLADPDNDGVSNYGELKLMTPNWIANAILPRLKTPIYRLMMSATKGPGNTDCYDLDVTDVPTLGWDNLIRVTVTQNQSAVENKQVLLRAIRPLDGKESEIEFSQENFR